MILLLLLPIWHTLIPLYHTQCPNIHAYITQQDAQKVICGSNNVPVKSDRLPSRLAARSNPIDDWFFEETVGPARIPPCLQQPAPYHTNTCSCPLLNALKSAPLVQKQQCFCSNCNSKLNTPVCPSITDTQCPATNQANTGIPLLGSPMDQVKPLAIASIKTGCNDCPWAPPTISTIPSSLSSATEPSQTDHLKPASSSAYRIQFTEPCHTPRWLLTQLCSLPLATLNEMFDPQMTFCASCCVM